MIPIAKAGLLVAAAKVAEVAVKQAIEWFKRGPKPSTIAKHAESVMKAAEKVARP